MQVTCGPLKETGAGCRGGRGWGSGSILGAGAQRTIYGRRGHALETVKAFTRCKLLSQLTGDLQVSCLASPGLFLPQADESNKTHRPSQGGRAGARVAVGLVSPRGSSLSQ